MTIGTPKEQAHRNTPRRKKYYPSSQSYFYKYFTINVGHTYTNYQTNTKNKGQKQQIKQSKRKQILVKHNMRKFLLYKKQELLGKGKAPW